MSWRTVYITGQAKLDYKLGFLVVRKIDSLKRVHLSEISVLIVESTQAAITTALISKLIDNKIKVIFSDDQHNPQSELVSLYGSYDTSMKIKQQMKFKPNTQMELWTSIITQKITNQMNILKKNDLTPEAELLQSYIEQIEFNDSSNREGHAAKVYFNALFGKSFTRSDDNPINASLNYGYGIIASIISREIVSLGYLTQLGIYHDNVHNRFNLSYDLIEPLRYFVDDFVVDKHPSNFDEKIKIELLNLLNKEVSINNKKCVLLYAIKLYVRSAMKCLEENDISEINYIINEL